MRMQRNIFDRILEKNHLNVTFVAKNFLRKAIATHILENITPILISIRKRFVNKLLTLDFLDLVQFMTYDTAHNY